MHQVAVLLLDGPTGRAGGAARRAGGLAVAAGQALTGRVGGVGALDLEGRDAGLQGRGLGLGLGVVRDGLLVAGHRALEGRGRVLERLAGGLEGGLGLGEGGVRGRHELTGGADGLRGVRQLGRLRLDQLVEPGQVGGLAGSGLLLLGLVELAPDARRVVRGNRDLLAHEMSSYGSSLDYAQRLYVSHSPPEVLFGLNATS